MTDQITKGEPGWVGEVVLIRSLDQQTSESKISVVVYLDKSGNVNSSDKDLLKKWSEEGIVGRAEKGRLHPKDGQQFLDELPFMYKSAYYMAVPAGVSMENIDQLESLTPEIKNFLTQS